MNALQVIILASSITLSSGLAGCDAWDKLSNVLKFVVGAGVAYGAIHIGYRCLLHRKTLKAERASSSKHQGEVRGLEQIGKNEWKYTFDGMQFVHFFTEDRDFDLCYSRTSKIVIISASLKGPFHCELEEGTRVQINGTEQVCFGPEIVQGNKPKEEKFDFNPRFSFWGHAFSLYQTIYTYQVVGGNCPQGQPLKSIAIRSLFNI